MKSNAIDIANFLKKKLSGKKIPINGISSLDKLTKGKSSKIDQLAELDSVKSIIQILIKKNLTKK